MSERYTRLFTLPEGNLYAIGSSIIICAGALLKDTLSGNIIAQLKFRNIGNKTVSALKVSIRTYDIFGKELEGITEYQYLDLAVLRDQEFGQKTAVVLPNPDTRSFCCDCRSIVFADGSVWEAKEANWSPLKKQESLQSRFGDLISQYQRDIGDPEARFVAIEDRDLWLCTCGTINNSEEKICHSCKTRIEKLKEAEDMTLLNEHLQEYLQKEEQARLETERRAEIARAEEAQKAEEERIAAEKTKKRWKQIVAIVTPIILACIAFVIVLVSYIIPNKKYNSALELYKSRKYEEAIAAFEAIAGFKDSKEKIQVIKPLYHDELLNNASAGSVVFFGCYEQDNEVATANEDIEWLVLKRDNNRILLISRYVLDCHRFDYDVPEGSASWGNSSIRYWLNNSFFENAFSSEEQERIQAIPIESISPATGYVYTTTDKVFLLSISEASDYFVTDKERTCLPTDYASEQIVVNGGKLYGATCEWWLLPSDSDPAGVYAAGVLDDGWIQRSLLSDITYFGVRPVIWVDLNSEN